MVIIQEFPFNIFIANKMTKTLNFTFGSVEDDEDKVQDRNRYREEMKESLLPKRTFSKDDDIHNFSLDAKFSENGINFVAIDLETATAERNSICEIGITIVENSKVKASKSWLVKPPHNEYDYFNIMVHGIHPKDTAYSPSFKEVWKEVEPFLDGKVVVAHNTAFDMYVLRDSFWLNKMKFPNFVFFCSYRLSTKAVKNCYSYSLPYVCEALGIDFGQHHRAGSDSDGCAEVFLKCINLSEASSFAGLEEKYDFRCGRFSENYFRPQLSNATSGGNYNIKVSKIKGDPSKIDEGSYFYGKEVCFTGTCKYGKRMDLLQMIADIGGIPVDSVTKQTNILVVGQQDYRIVGEDGMSNKQKKAIKLKDSGFDIEIMSEEDFLSNI